MSKYLLVPLRTTVVFPGHPAALTVEDTPWVGAIERALASASRVVTVALQNPEQDGIDPENLATIGTLVEIKSVSRKPDGTADVVVEGLSRVGMEAVLTTRKPFQVRALEVEEDETQGGGLGQMRHATALAERYARLSRNLPASMMEQAQAYRRPGPLADYLAAHLPLDIATKQEILETFDHRQRLDRIIDTLAGEVEILELDQKIRNRVRRQMERNQREYFLKEQLKAITAELGQDLASEVDRLRARIAEKHLPAPIEARIQSEVQRLERTPQTSPESGVIRNYLELVLALPWDERTEDRLDINEAQRILDDDHYGLATVKERILEFLSVKQLLARVDAKAVARGPILCLIGPPGVGKTSLGRSVARAMGRKFQRVSLGGVRDEAEIRGHRRTYVAALAGRIIQSLRQAGSRNPVILLDEVDKMGADFRGDPAAALLEVLDPEQNHAFVDHYLDLPFDLSEVLFICSANAAALIPRALADRMETLEIAGYSEEEKVEIGRRFLLPKQLQLHGLQPGQVEIPLRIMHEIVRHHTHEAGVRGLERALATVCRRAARQVVQSQKGRIRVTPRSLETYLGKPRYRSSAALERAQIGVVTGLAWTDRGGELLPVEVVTMPGKGNLIITGRLGDVMQESARAALSYARSRARELGIDESLVERIDLHIHVPEGAIPKDGPSAGVAMATALISVLTGRPVPNDLAMTGEITLRGAVLPIGGLKEKVLAARRAGIRRIIVPLQNQQDSTELPREVRQEIEFVWVQTIDDVLRAVFTAPEGGSGDDLEPTDLGDPLPDLRDPYSAPSLAEDGNLGGAGPA